VSDWTALGLAVVLLGLNAFFVGAEFALISARRSQIEPRAQEGSRVARTTLRAMEHVSQMMAGAQLGITICSLGLGAIGEPAVAHLLEPVFELLGVPEQLVYPISFVIALTVVVSAHVVLGEMVPKNIAIAGPERAALLLAPPMVAIVTVLKPVILVLNAIATLTLRTLRVEPRDEVSSTYTRAEVAALVEESRGEGMIEDSEYDRLSGALGFTEKTVAAVLMPSATLTTVPTGATVAEVEEACATTGYSRFPVRSGSDELVGYLHVKDVLGPDEGGRDEPVADAAVRPFATVRATDRLHEALETLRRTGAHLTRVTDDTGAVLGVATLEDLIEELVGEIRDAAHADEPATTG